MDPTSKAFLSKLLNTPGPSGYEWRIQNVVREYLSNIADEINTDLHGNVIACKNPNANLRVMYAGHCDQIGMLVSQIDENGFIYFQTIGGWDPQQLLGQRVAIWPTLHQGEEAEPKTIPGVIARKAIHLLEESERKHPVKAKDLWIDIGARSQEEAKDLVSVGDPVTLQLGMQEMLNSIANAPAMDDRTGLWVCLEAFRRAAKRTLDCSLYVVSTVQEEVGLRGATTAAYSVDPHVGIAVDVTHATDCPTIDKRQQGEIELCQGPVIFRGPNMNPKVVRRLIDVANERELPYQISALGRAAPNDSSALQTTRGGVATGLVSIPNRYMHTSVETISLDDIDKAADLLAEFALSCASGDDFTP